jgi:uncharacterized protein (DUF4415 family)
MSAREPAARRGRPPKPDRKVPVSLRLPPATLEHFKAGGKGWQRRIEDVLNAAIAAEGKDSPRP